MSVRIVVTEQLDDEPLAWLEERADVMQVTQGDGGFDEAIHDAQGLVVRTYTQVDEALLQSAPSLKVVGRAGTGLDNIDLEACAARGIEVVHVPDANRQAVVEYVTSMLAHIVRPLPPPIEGGMSSEAWTAMRRAAIAPRQMSELRLGVLGLGRIGTRVAQIAAAIGFDVRYTDLRNIPEGDRGGACPVPFESLLAESDILTVHVDGRPGNHHLLSGDRLDTMRPDAVLVNTARGMVLDTTALAHTLERRPSMRAILDVHEIEPVPAGCPLHACPGAMLLPHAASRTRAAQRAMSWVVRDVARVLGLT